MLFLSFDTSGRELTVALFEGGPGTESGGKLLDEERIDFADIAANDPRLPIPGASSGTNSGTGSGAKKANRQESVSLLIPTIDQILRRQDLNKSNIGCLAVGIGPGGFTGIRVAITTARTIAQALKLPLIGINSLEVAAFNLQASGQVGIIKEASRSHCYMAVYRPEAMPGLDFSDVQAEVLPNYLTYEAMLEQQHLAPLWHCDATVLEKLPLLQSSEMLPPKILQPIKNIASQQSKMAWLRVSLKGTDSAFHYRLTEPLYLRGASVTLKKGDAVERVESN